MLQSQAHWMVNRRGEMRMEIYSVIVKSVSQTVQKKRRNTKHPETPQHPKNRSKPLTMSNPSLSPIVDPNPSPPAQTPSSSPPRPRISPSQNSSAGNAPSFAITHHRWRNHWRRNLTLPASDTCLMLVFQISAGCGRACGGFRGRVAR